MRLKKKKKQPICMQEIHSRFRGTKQCAGFA